MTMTTTNNHLAEVIVAQALERAGLADWIPEGEGKWSLPIQFLPDDAGWVELMRLSPGTRLGLHRHTGEVHALTLAGERRLNDGRVVRPGDYIHEPAGNVDWWEATGTEELLVHVVVRAAWSTWGRTTRCCSGSLWLTAGRTTTAGVRR